MAGIGLVHEADSISATHCTVSLSEHNERRLIAVFLILTLLLSAIFWILITEAGHLSAADGHYLIGLMWAPAVAAYLSIRICQRDPRSLGLSSFGGRFSLLGYLLPLFYASFAYGVLWMFGFGVFPNKSAIEMLSVRLGWQFDDAPRFALLYFILTAVTGIVPATARALGEEIGWRGFLSPMLVGRLGFTWGAVVMGIIWVAWHIPILLFADYSSATPRWYALSCFSVLTIGMSVVLAWLRLRSNSVWPCALLHGSHNLFLQSFYTPLMAVQGPFTAYAIDEFGFAVPGTILAIALCLRYRVVRCCT